MNVIIHKFLKIFIFVLCTFLILQNSKDNCISLILLTSLFIIFDLYYPQIYSYAI